MKRILSFVALPVLTLTSCGEDTEIFPDGRAPEASVDAPADTSGDVMGTDGGFPAAPMLGDQVDRMGRPGINTALTDPFWDNDPRPARQMANNTMHKAAQDSYNQLKTPAMWGPMWAGKIKASLAVLDGLDGVCGNQVAADLMGARYSALAGVLADDQLFVDASHGTCDQFLGVEANALGVTNTDCGGRTLTENTIDLIYNLLVNGMFAGTLTNGITMDNVTHSNDTFPFLADPTP